MDEIVRVVDALQLSAAKSVATPANWPNNHADQGMLPEAVVEMAMGCTLTAQCLERRGSKVVVLQTVACPT